MKRTILSLLIIACCVALAHGQAFSWNCVGSPVTTCGSFSTISGNSTFTYSELQQMAVDSTTTSDNTAYYMGSDSSSHDYYYNLCGIQVVMPATQASPYNDCATDPGGPTAVCQVSDSGTSQASGRNGGVTTSLRICEHPNGPDQGIAMFIGGGRTGCSPKVARTSFLIIDCDSTVDGTVANPSVNSVDGVCNYTMSLSSKYACPDGSGSGGDDGGDGDKDDDDDDGGLSGGSIFLIVVACLVVVYFVVGVLVMRFHFHATGVEMIPNVDFWRALGGYIKAGCVVSWQATFGKLMGGSGGGSYESVE